MRKSRAHQPRRQALSGRQTSRDERSTPAVPATTAERSPQSNVLSLTLKPNQSKLAALAELAVSGLETNAITLVQFTRPITGEADLTEIVRALNDLTNRVQRGNLDDLEAWLSAQAAVLNVMFNTLAQRAFWNMGEHLDASERYFRLAFKAQNQARETIETWATIKNPPTVFARQANIAQGPQQVNNNAMLPNIAATSSRACAETQTEQNELLEAHGERVDDGAADPTSARDSGVAAVGAVHRPSDD